MKLRILALLVFLSASTSFAQNTDSLMFRKISDEIMLHGNCYNNLRVLCKSVGHRISGSPEAARAVAWGEKAMREAGADKVWLQACDVPYWYRGQESLQLKMGKKYETVAALSLGNSEGTCGRTLNAQVVMVHSYDEFKRLPSSSVKGKIIFFNYRFRQDFIFTFQGYGDAVKYRGGSASIAAERGAVGVIIRSMSTGEDDFPHTGAMYYKDSSKKIPVMAIGNKTADLLEGSFNNSNGDVMAKMRSECHMMPHTVRSYNVIGEIKGTEYPDRIITIGGHLDSWDVGEGAQDDGAGCVQSIEVIRAFKALGIKPKCTIRAVLFMNEENGQKGGQAYADSAASRHEQHILAVETDAGGFSPRGIGMEMPQSAKDKILAYKNLFLPYGVYDFSREGGGSDIEPIGKKLKVPLADLMPDSQRYFDIHHTNNDVFENVNHRELKLGAVVMTQFIWLVNEKGLN